MKMKFGLWAVSLAILTLLFVAAGCGGSGGGGEQLGTVAGKVLYPNKAMGGVPGATVGILTADKGAAADSWFIQTKTDAVGEFTLANVPVGSQKITIVTDKGSRKSFIANVQAGQTYRATEDQCHLPPDSTNGGLRVAVVKGVWDNIENVVKVFGVTDYHLWNGNGINGEVSKGSLNTLLTGTKLADSYDVLFFPCGADTSWLDDPAKVTLVKNWVAAGNTLYVTDLASDILPVLFPGAVVFVTGGGESGITTEGTVLDTTLKAQLKALGALTATDKLHIEGFLSGWSVIKSVGAGTSKLVEGLVSYDDFGTKASGHAPRPVAPGANVLKEDVRPLTVTFRHGDGHVVYSSYHTHEGESSNTLTPQEKLLGILAF